MTDAKTEMLCEYGEDVRIAIMKTGRSASAVAEEMQINRSRLRKIEAGARPTQEEAAQILDVLGVTPPPDKPPEIRSVSVMTLRANLCQRARTFTAPWACAACAEPCEYGTEYLRRHMKNERARSAEAARAKKREETQIGAPGPVKNFPRWLKRKMEQKGFSADELSERSGISATAISSICCGRSCGSFMVQRQLIRGLGATEEEALEEARLMDE